MDRPVPLDWLKAHEGQVLELRFTDGYAAVVRLLDVSEEHEDSDVIYDVLKVLSWGPIDPANVDMKAAHAAASRDLAEASVAKEPSSGPHATNLRDD
jgi:hypothetical protein